MSEFKERQEKLRAELEEARKELEEFEKRQDTTVRISDTIFGVLCLILIVLELKNIIEILTLENAFSVIFSVTIIIASITVIKNIGDRYNG